MITYKRYCWITALLGAWFITTMFLATSETTPILPFACVVAWLLGGFVYTLWKITRP